MILPVSCLILNLMAFLNSKINGLCVIKSGILDTGVYWGGDRGGVWIRARYKDQEIHEKQYAWRDVYRKVDAQWKTLGKPERNKWRLRPWKKGWSNYAFFMSVNLKNARCGRPLQLVPKT